MRESTRGIELRRHPESILLEHPRLWDVVSRWRSGVQHELTRTDYEELPNFEVECWLVLYAAHARELERRTARTTSSTEGAVNGPA